MMGLRLYNTLKKEKERFVPLSEGKVGMYVCGPTVYDDCHMGHARASIVFDVVFRYLKYLGYHVTYVRNITDIDDKIIRKANEESVDFREITKRYIRSFHDDMVDLGNEPPTHEPKATEHIDDIIGIIEKLISSGRAYESEGSVYYKVEGFDGYGKLSGRKTDELLAGARVEVDERKDNPLDFALWKASRENEPKWDSPWGKGRPGWHIECSAMSCHHLGETFDIHGGGKDLIFPHHENEIAQSEGASGKIFAKYWLHNGFVNVNQEKMSKSLGNFFTIRDLLNRYHPEILRFFLLTTHYRSPIDYTDQNLLEAEKGLEKIYNTIDRMDRIVKEGADSSQGGHREGEGEDAEAEELINTLYDRFREAMNDDFNTALAIASIFETVRAINRWINSPLFLKSRTAIKILVKARSSLTETGNVLGVLVSDPSVFLSVLQKKRSDKHHVNESLIEELVAERWAARNNKEWGKSDQIRDRLAEMGVTLKDSSDGTTWELKG